MEFDQMIFILNELSKKAAIIRKLDRDNLKHDSDFTVIDSVLQKEIDRLAKEED
ncbi:hypothetical protein [Lysinibacillus fusiformis]|uniref:hypothetical protein n=1 Tax=Lysinibacillus fusiformis TaxID=28031 RepID=UPI003D00163E